MRDFTLKKYSLLLDALAEAGYTFLTFGHYCRLRAAKGLPPKYIILRHDVDKYPRRAVAMGQLEQDMNICSSYYLRAQRGQEQVIQTLVRMGHEIGYHYEDLSVMRGKAEKAYESFKSNIEYLRRYADIRTCSKHGSVGSKYDELQLWQQFDYHDLNLSGETYLDTDFAAVRYLTDTGRMWDGDKHGVNQYDRVPSQREQAGVGYHHTDEMIEAIRSGSFPQRVMLSAHPQRWTDDIMKWGYELIRQNAVNAIKKIIIDEK